MLKNIYFSIILPTYNRADFLSKAIESVISQSFTRWELIIIDDGSTDNTKILVEKYQKTQKQIRYIYQKNSERSAARNNGIKNSYGQWICFLDSDDLYHHSHLATFYELIIKNDIEKSIIFSGVSYGSFQDTNQNYDKTGKNNLEFILLNTIGTPRACCHREILINNQFNNSIRIGEDKELWSRLVLKYPMYYHRAKTFIEIDHNKRSIYIDNGFQNLYTMKSIVKNKRVTKRLRKMIISNAYFNISKHYIFKMKKIRAIYYLFISIFEDLNNKLTLHKILLMFSLFTGLNKRILKEYIN